MSTPYDAPTPEPADHASGHGSNHPSDQPGSAGAAPDAARSAESSPTASPAVGDAWPHPAAPYGASPYAAGHSPYGSYGGYGVSGASYGDPTGGHDAAGGGYGAAYGSASNPYGGGGYASPGWAAPPSFATPGSDRAADGSSGRRGTGRTVLVAAVVAAVVGGGVGAGIATAVSDNSSSAGSVAVSNQAAPAAKVDGSIAAAASAISPSVVTINVSAARGQAGGTGSGIVIKTDGGTGYILTNNHVVTLDSQTKASSNTISVTLANGSTTGATVVGTDPFDDLAVVKVQASGLTAAVFASSSKLQVGQTVVAMGAPLGLSNTVTSGIVSALARPVATGSTQDAAIFNAIQTDAAINPGNSGGPLVDLNGHVVGVNSAIAGTGSGSSDSQSGNIGIGFAIPSDEASRIAGELIANGKAAHAVLGIGVNGTSQQSGPTSGAGATVASVQSGSPAAQAGIAAGDVITKIGDQRIDDSIGAIAATRSYAPGTTVSVTLTSNGASKTVQVKLGSATDG